MNPADLAIWKRRGGNPITPHTGFDWQWTSARGHNRHGRDPHVVRVGDHFLLAYTTMHKDGCPVVGGLISRDLQTFEDIGPILYRKMPKDRWWPESVNIQPLDDWRWVMIPSMSPGLEYYIGDDPHEWHDITPKVIHYADGPIDQPVAIEVLVKRGDRWLVSFFERNFNRLFIGELDLSADPWRLTRLREQSQVDSWLVEKNG